MKFLAVLVLIVLKEASGVIYRLNESEYARMPPLFRLEDFDGCLRAPGDTYCYLDAKIIHDDTSKLSTLIQEYSASDLTHFDHNLFHWGVCVTQTCRQYYDNSTLEHALDACVNATLYATHNLQARLINESILCTEFGESQPYDAGDYVVAVVFLTLLGLNVCGSIYDLYFHSPQKGFVSRLLLCFSVKRNWQRLVMSSGEGPESKMKSLKCLNGIKVMTALLTIMGHSTVTNFNAMSNPRYLEEEYHEIKFQAIANGTLIVQAFLLMSGLLLSYSILISEEKRRFGWRSLPQGIVLRWLRLTPVYAAAIAFGTTWLRHLSYGPLWKLAVNVEVVDCRSDWWLHLLYVDNYVDHSQCMLQTWYLAADMQLTILGMVIFCLCRSARSRKIAIAVAFVVGLITPAAHTYFQNLYGVLLLTPRIIRTFVVHDPTFNKVYKRGDANLVTYAMGLALGVILYDMHGKDFKKTKKHRLMYWAATPAAAACIFLGMVFFIDNIQIPLLVCAVYSSAIKVCFGACLCGLIAGSFLKLDTFVSGVMGWHGWAFLGRLTYCVYLLHLYVIRTRVGLKTALQQITYYHSVLDMWAVAAVSFMLAVPCWLLVESPMAQLVKLIFEVDRKTDKSDVTVKVAPRKWSNEGDGQHRGDLS